MSSSHAISFQDVSKVYKLGQISHGFLFKDLQSWWSKKLGKLDPNLPLTSNQVEAESSEFYALRNVSFDVKKGEIIGIVGRNGAGKSTLLKLLSRVTSPTSGKIKFNGRIASLLEVGTGFHPELTGRENVFLNGAILGMTRNEIRNKFDEIVDFSGVSRFIDTPVKRYSSGMYVRLAFAVAAHLEPDILVIDEVLAVGDIEFQRKCLGKMESVSKESGRTIMFVSHNMAAINALCEKVVYLKSGQVKFIGGTNDGISRYLQDNQLILKSSLAERSDRQGEGQVKFLETWTEDSKGERKELFLSGEDLVIAALVKFSIKLSYKKLSFAFQLQDQNDYTITDLNTKSVAKEFDIPSSETAVIRCKVNRLPLTPGSYSHHVIVRTDGIVQDLIVTAGKFMVEEGDFFGTGQTIDQGHGFILLNQEWSFDFK